MDVPPHKSGIYKILNKINGKIYIGSAVNLYKRWIKHKRYAKGNYHHSQAFQRAWNKYGEANFEFLILEIIEDKTKLAEREQIYLDWFTPYNPNIGYNICKIGKSHVGLKRSEQARENMRQGQLGSIQTFEHRENIGISNSKPDKWPCPDKSRCLCDNCKDIRNKLSFERREAKAIKEGRFRARREVYCRGKITKRDA